MPIVVPTWLYRLYDVKHRLLYVGITQSPGIRMSQHAKDKAWWNDADHATFTEHPTPRAAAEAERNAIYTEKPEHNVAFAVWHPYQLPTAEQRRRRAHKRGQEAAQQHRARRIVEQLACQVRWP